MCRRRRAVLSGPSVGWNIHATAQWRLHLLAGSILVFLTYGCSPVNDVTCTIAPTQVPSLVDYSPPIPAASPAAKLERIILARASWYGPGLEGRKTANGERFSSSKMTVAARGLPLGSQVVVTNLSNGRSARVRINDCGPFGHGRKIDLSKGAARKIGIIHDGMAPVRIKMVEVPPGALVCEL
jgi:rare lipoprotein A (RlpA)-like double-psi beta-barrel protein